MQTPATLLEQIVYDADLFHLSTYEFFERNKLMRKEYERIDMSDNKADIMISVNSIISVIIVLVVRRLDAMQHIIPALI